MSVREQGMLVLHTPLGHTSLVVGVTPVELPDLPPLDRIRRVVIRTIDQPICWRDDDTDPTGSTGMFLDAAETLVYDSTRADLLRFVKADSADGDADVRVAYYGV